MHLFSGSMSEGIYRKSGSEKSVQSLMKQFRSHAHSLEITQNDYTEHDVANMLKRFLRELPTRLLGACSPSFISISKMKEYSEKIKAYKELLTRLTLVEYYTLRKLLRHLHFIQSQKSVNKMDYSNLGIVWGTTLLQEQDDDDHISFSQSSAKVVVDLIRLHKNLYEWSAEEIEKEQKMLVALQKCHATDENLTNSMRLSGDLKVWITMDINPENQREEKKQVNVTLTPTKTADEICKELAPIINRAAYELSLNEVILNGTLQRPLHYSEKVLDVVLIWSHWSHEDRKDNFLQLTWIRYRNEIERALKDLSLETNKELQFADSKTKSLKSHTLELIHHKISVMKREKDQTVLVKEIDLRQSTAYLGCEKKRSLQPQWAITLIDHHSSVADSKCVYSIRFLSFCVFLIYRL